MTAWSLSWQTPAMHLSPRQLFVFAVTLLACDTQDTDRTTLSRQAPPIPSTPIPSDALDALDGSGDPDPDTAPTDTAPTDTAPSDTSPADTSPTDTAPTDTAPADTAPTDTSPADTSPADTAPADTSPSDTSPTDTAPAGPATLAPLGAACHVGTATGTCRHLADCDDTELPVEGFCEGHPQVRCCLPAWDRCSAMTRPGACLETAACPAPDWQSTSGLCPGPANVRCCTSSTAPPACDPSVRPDPNAGLTEEPGDPGCPPGMARITRPASPSGGFCIDRFEASLVLAADPTRHLSPFHNPGATATRAVSLRYGVPQGYIDQVRATAACANAGKRLCSSPEWLYACQGAEGRTYPYGPVRVPGACNDARRQHVAVELFPNDPNRFGKIGNACLSQLPDSVHLAGEHEACQTPEAVYDLMGNVHEWVDDPAGTFRGGFFSDTSINGNGCLYRTTAHDVSHWDYSTGFRCCADL